jgi:hypothetical protein
MILAELTIVAVAIAVDYAFALFNNVAHSTIAKKNNYSCPKNTLFK